LAPMPPAVPTPPAELVGANQSLGPG
jgi:hypothetical protein